MSWTIEDAFNDDVIEKTATTGEGYSFWLKGMPVEITVHLSANPEGGYYFSLSHAIQTPFYTRPYHPRRLCGKNHGHALHLAVSSVTPFYRQAVKEGHIPSESWLIPNRYK